jgi:chromatin remodeling complex protein RSC6
MNEPNDSGLEKSVATETSDANEVDVEQVEETQMDIEVLKEALGSVIDQKFDDFATSLKNEVEEKINAKIDEVTKNFDAQKTELTQKLEATEAALAEQTAKVEEFAQAGAMKKSVDTEETEEVELKKSAEPKSVWNNVYLPQSVIKSLGYRS